MRTEKGHFGFLHSWDLMEMMKANDRGEGPRVLNDAEYGYYINLSNGERTQLIVSDYETRGAGIQDGPCEKTVRSFERHGERTGRPLPWL